MVCVNLFFKSIDVMYSMYVMLHISLLLLRSVLQALSYNNINYHYSFKKA